MASNTNNDNGNNMNVEVGEGQENFSLKCSDENLSVSFFFRSAAAGDSIKLFQSFAPFSFISLPGESLNNNY